jgi:glutathionylspermidine synthase
VAEDVLRGAGYTTVVRVFHELLPFVRDLCDLAHYTVPRVYEPVVQQAWRCTRPAVVACRGDVSSQDAGPFSGCPDGR